MTLAHHTLVADDLVARKTFLRGETHDERSQA